MVTEKWRTFASFSSENKSKTRTIFRNLCNLLIELAVSRHAQRNVNKTSKLKNNPTRICIYLQNSRVRLKHKKRSFGSILAFFVFFFFIASILKKSCIIHSLPESLASNVLPSQSPILAYTLSKYCLTYLKPKIRETSIVT